MSDDLARRIRRLEDIEAIRRLVSLYGLAMDNRDPALVAQVFAEDGEFQWEHGSVQASGREAIVEMFRGRFARISFHVTHDHMIEIDDNNPHAARGIVFAHAEAQRDDGHYVAATRYQDKYVRTAEGWQIAERVLQHLYFVPVAEYSGVLDRPDRISTPAGRLNGHWPR